MTGAWSTRARKYASAQGQLVLVPAALAAPRDLALHARQQFVGRRTA